MLTVWGGTGKPWTLGLSVRQCGSMQLIWDYLKNESAKIWNWIKANRTTNETEKFLIRPQQIFPLVNQQAKGEVTFKSNYNYSGKGQVEVPSVAKIVSDD